MIRVVDNLNDVCLKARNWNGILNEIILSDYSNKQIMFGTVSLTFKIFSSNEQIEVAIKSPIKEHLHTFSGINFKKPLYPVFGLTSHPKVDMTLKSGTNVDRFSLLGFHFYKPVCMM